MSTLAELARAHTALSSADLGHLQRLVASWGMLADLCFADLVLFVPVSGSAENRFAVLGQMRPTTNQTLYREDLVGRVTDEVERPLVARAWRLGEIVEGEIIVTTRGERARLQCIPVRRQNRMVAVLTRESAPSVGRRPGELERVYVETFDRFARMLVQGAFPFPPGSEDEVPHEAPRVGDGVLVLDSAGRVEYSSPNAVNALHRLEVTSNAEGMRLDELSPGIDSVAIPGALATGKPATEEITRRPDAAVLLRCIPLIDSGKVTGAMVLLRDVSDLRVRDRLLMTKDATIREVHHRVKNNLQTISSLLRLQARRLVPGEGRTALEEAERRIRSIMLVHEILSRDASDQVDFNDIVQALVRMAEEGVFAADVEVEFVVEGDAGELVAELATPLGVVLTELLQNAVEHAFVRGPGAADGRAQVRVCLSNDGEELTLIVRDNGRGWPDGFTIEDSDSLGLSIVQSLVVTQLGGRLELRTDSGAFAEVRVPSVVT